MSHHVKASDVYQIDTGSNSVPVLGLRSLSKCPKIYQVYLPITRDLQNFVVGPGLMKSSG